MSASAKRHHGLDATRGICALLVAAYHFMVWSNVGDFYSIGLFAVYAFFILSSVTLCMVYGEGFAEAVTATALARYALNRMARILPLLAVVALVAFADSILRLHGSWNDLFTLIFTTTGLLAFGPSGMLSNTVGGWSLGIEILFYFLFPIMCLLMIRRPTMQLLVVAAVALAAQNLFSVLLLYHHGLIAQWNLYISPLAFGYYFAVGFVIYRISFTSAFNLVAGLMLVLATVCVSLLWKTPAEQLLMPPFGVLIPLLLSGAILLIFNSQAHPAAIRAFEFIGAISYSSYLFHPFIYIAVSMLSRHLHLQLATSAAVFAASTIAFAYASYRLFELPARNWIRRKIGTSTVPLAV